MGCLGGPGKRSTYCWCQLSPHPPGGHCWAPCCTSRRDSTPTQRAARPPSTLLYAQGWEGVKRAWLCQVFSFLGSTPCGTVGKVQVQSTLLLYTASVPAAAILQCCLSAEISYHDPSPLAPGCNSWRWRCTGGPDILLLYICAAASALPPLQATRLQLCPAFSSDPEKVGP